MVKLKIFIFNKLADLVFIIMNSSYYKMKSSAQYLMSFKSVGSNCSLHESSTIINPQYISIGDNFRASRNFRLEVIDHYERQKFSPKVTIGNNVIFHRDVHIGCIKYISIGNNCLFASRVFITDHDHGDTTFESMIVEPAKRELTSKGSVIIGDNCWIGEGVAILSGVTIGNNAIVATNSVVNKDIPAFSIAAGVPAKIIRAVQNNS